MRPYLVPLIGAILLIIGIVIVLTNRDLATVALVFQIAGVVLLGFYMVAQIVPDRGSRRGRKR
ncbi:hypothetical protein [Paramicrobacterium agarici]|uniref:Uncharacterized protein n=1 Tax=Paramicrobacterium agarici TaxID=630514 RepID=A0A2A9DW38_9MICO|nr:hypothetical protein [Microbacterium agarici]PFG30150.1 hypothetical protein ATJ78_1072 [Microbacterium agarici]TQO23158.1 hypothetical protein FB385_2004 [Microbacterium agarici]